MTRVYLAVALLVLSLGTALRAAPSGAFSGSFPSYTSTVSCADPVGASILFGVGPCNLADIDYTASGSTSLFTNAELILQTFLNPALPGPFPFSGTFVLTDLDNSTDSIFGTLAGAGNVAGPPGPPVGFPPFVINATLTTTGGTGAFASANGTTLLSGNALFTFISDDTTFALAEGSLTFTAVPEPGSAVLVLTLLPLAPVLRRRIRCGGPGQHE